MLGLFSKNRYEVLSHPEYIGSLRDYRTNNNYIDIYEKILKWLENDRRVKEPFRCQINHLNFCLLQKSRVDGTR